jgi:hypothetical protein
MKSLFWIKEGLRSGCLLLAGGLFYGIFMTVISNGGNWQSIMLTSGTFLAFFGCFMAMMYCSRGYSDLLSLAVSFGCTRGEGVLGLQIYRLFTLVLPALGSALALALSVTDGKRQEWIALVIAGFLFFSSLGGTAGYYKIKKNRVTLMVMLAALVAAVAMTALCVSGVWSYTARMGWTVLAVVTGLYVFCGVSEVKSFCGH